MDKDNGGSGGILPQEFFEIKVRDKRFVTVVAIYMACSVLHPIFSCPYTHLLSQVTYNFKKVLYNNSKWGDGDK